MRRFDSIHHLRSQQSSRRLNRQRPLRRQSLWSCRGSPRRASHETLAGAHEAVMPAEVESSRAVARLRPYGDEQQTVTRSELELQPKQVAQPGPLRDSARASMQAPLLQEQGQALAQQLQAQVVQAQVALVWEPLAKKPLGSERLGPQVVTVLAPPERQAQQQLLVRHPSQALHEASQEWRSMATSRPSKYQPMGCTHSCQRCHGCA